MFKENSEQKMQSHFMNYDEEEEKILGRRKDNLSCERTAVNLCFTGLLIAKSKRVQI